MRSRLQVIVPVRNEELNVPYFYGRAVVALDQLMDVDWSIVFVNNGSEDATLATILKLRATDPRIKVISLSRDFGYHAALIAGLSSVDADHYAMIDVDCEDPPELLSEFYRAIQGGAQLAYGIRSNREEPRAIVAARRIFYELNRRVADSQIVVWMGEFSMITRPVRDAILVPRTTYPFLRAEMGYVGFRRVGIPYVRSRRRYGASHYDLWRMTQFAVGGILASSTFPLRFVLYLAVVLAIAFPIAVALLRLSLADAAAAAGIMGVYFLLVTIPILALYVARSYKNGVGRPLFVIDPDRTHL